MKLAFSIYDSKAQFFSAPIFFAHRGEAIRAVISTAADLTTSIGQYPADFSLWYLGEFNENTGEFRGAPPENMGPVSQFTPIIRHLQPQPNGSLVADGYRPEAQ